MNPSQRRQVLKLAKIILPEREFRRLIVLKCNDTGFGFDPFGMERETVVLFYLLARYVYKYWFRVRSYGHENLPVSNRVLIAPNHSGVIPTDGAMLAIDLIMKCDPPRLMRAVADHFMGVIPFFGTLLSRIGLVVGARRNFRDLLEMDQTVIVFPEGAKGPGKPFRARYNLLKFNVGFVELALLHKTAVVPTAIIGAEEQAPMLYDIKPLARLINAPYFPITPFFPLFGPFGTIPLPTRYTIFYGKPLSFHSDYPPEAAEDIQVVRMLADKVQIAVQELIDAGLHRREGIFY